MAIKLHQFPPWGGLPISTSPFCAKLEAYLRLTDRNYEVVHTDNRSSPTKQLPYATMEDGEVVAGSDQVIEKLEAAGPALDEGLSEDAKATATELERSAEDVLYFGTLYTRWADDAGWRACKGMVLDMMPPIIGGLFVGFIRKPVVARAARHGFAGPDDLPKAVKVVEQLSDSLADKPFFTGDTPRVVDCSIFGQLAIAASIRSDNPVTKAIESTPNLIAFVNRVADESGFEMSF